MAFFGKKTREEPFVQLRSVKSNPFGVLADYSPGGADSRLYQSIREAVPIIDAAVQKLIRLTGGFEVKCSGKAAEAALREFLRSVDVGRGRRGINAFLDSYMDSLFVSGRAVGEIVCRGGGEIAAVLCHDLRDVEIREGDTALDFVICGRNEKMEMQPLPYQNLLLFTPFCPEADSPYGVSLLRSMPFLADVLVKIYHTIGLNWERAGNVRYSVVYRPAGDALDRAFAKERGETLAKEWSRAMRESRGGAVRDFVAVGDVDIKVIGADGQILDPQSSIRQILEQLVAKTGIPPSMLGLAWSTTERMSSQQADVMTSEITSVRRSLDPVIERICEHFLADKGFPGGVEIVWDSINLQDAVEEARAELYSAQAQNLRAGMEVN